MTTTAPTKSAKPAEPPETEPQANGASSGPGRPTAAMPASDRIAMCEREIGDVLQKHGCRLLPALRWDPVGRGNTLTKLQVEAVVSIVPDLQH